MEEAPDWLQPSAARSMFPHSVIRTSCRKKHPDTRPDWVPKQTIWANIPMPSEKSTCFFLLPLFFLSLCHVEESLSLPFQCLIWCQSETLQAIQRYAGKTSIKVKISIKHTIVTGNVGVHPQIKIDLFKETQFLLLLERKSNALILYRLCSEH